MSETLTYESFLKEIEKIPVFESRIDDPDMKEFVVQSDSIMPLHLVFQVFFGDNFKAPGAPSTLEDKKRSALWGGVRQYQTLYYIDQEECSSCAMLWPWRDGTRCTVKIVRWKHKSL